jgi:hypothetical protein
MVINGPPEGDGLASRASRDPEEGSTKRDRRRWWSVARGGLLLLQAGATCTQHEALAAAARALVTIGDMIFSFGRQ